MKEIVKSHHSRKRIQKGFPQGGSFHPERESEQVILKFQQLVLNASDAFFANTSFFPGTILGLFKKPSQSQLHLEVWLWKQLSFCVISDGKSVTSETTCSFPSQSAVSASVSPVAWNCPHLLSVRNDRQKWEACLAKTQRVGSPYPERFYRHNGFYTSRNVKIPHRGQWKHYITTFFSVCTRCSTRYFFWDNTESKLNHTNSLLYIFTPFYIPYASPLGT